MSLFRQEPSGVGTKSTLRGRNEGRNSKPERLSQGPRVLVEGAYRPSPPARGFSGVLWAFTVGSGAQPQPPRILVHWGVLQLSCPAVLLCKTVYGPFIYSVSQKKIPPRFSDIFSKRYGIFRLNFARVLYVSVNAGLQIVIQLSSTVTKLWNIKCDHPTCVSTDGGHFEHIMVVALNMA